MFVIEGQVFTLFGLSSSSWRILATLWPFMKGMEVELIADHPLLEEWQVELHRRAKPRQSGENRFVGDQHGPTRSGEDLFGTNETGRREAILQPVD